MDGRRADAAAFRWTSSRSWGWPRCCRAFRTCCGASAKPAMRSPPWRRMRSSPSTAPTSRSGSQARARALRPGLRTIHYVAPSVWAWRPGRAAKMARVVDHVLALLPFEPPYMEAAGMTCDFVGHPVAAEPQATPEEVAAMRAELGVAPGQRSCARSAGLAAGRGDPARRRSSREVMRRLRAPPPRPRGGRCPRRRRSRRRHRRGCCRPTRRLAAVLDPRGRAGGRGRGAQARRLRRRRRGAGSLGHRQPRARRRRDADGDRLQRQPADRLDRAAHEADRHRDAGQPCHRHAGGAGVSSGQLHTAAR